MMNNQKSRCLPAFLIGAVVMLLLPAGCGRSTGVLELTSYKDAYTPQTYEVEIEECVYYTEPGGDYHILGRARYTPDDDPDGEIVQLLHVHLFWKPYPGKTYDNPTTIDATLRYAVITARGDTFYSGTGYAYPKKMRRGDDIVLTIEGGRLAPDSQHGEGPEVLGAARILGKMTAKKDHALAMDLRREIDLRAGR